MEIIIGVAVIIFIIWICMPDKKPDKKSSESEKKVGDASIHELFAFIDAFRQYAIYKYNSDMEPEEFPLHYYYDDGVEIKEVVHTADEQLNLLFTLLGSQLTVGFDLAGHANIFNAFCNTVGNSSYVRNDNILNFEFDDDLKNFWKNPNCFCYNSFFSTKFNLPFQDFETTDLSVILDAVKKKLDAVKKKYPNEKFNITINGS